MLLLPKVNLLLNIGIIHLGRKINELSWPLAMNYFCVTSQILLPLATMIYSDQRAQ